MRIVHCSQFDPAGTAWNLSRAMRTYAPEHESISVVCEKTLCAPDADMIAPNQEAASAEAVRDADVQIVHCGVNDWSGAGHASTPAYIGIDTHETGSWFAPFLRRERTIIWLDGSVAVRSNVSKYRQRYLGYRMIATNPDVAALYGAQWLPPCIDEAVNDGLFAHEPHFAPNPTLCHPYTDAALKGAPLVEAAVTEARPRWHLQPVLGEAHNDCLNAMARAQAIVDHFQGYFGVVTLEATAMGKPVLLRLSNASRIAMLDAGWPVPSNWISVEEPAQLSRTLIGLHAAIGSASFLSETHSEARRWWTHFGHNAHRVRRFTEWLCRS